MEEAACALDRVIVLDGALVFEGADALQIGWHRPPRRLWIGRGLSEARVVAGPEAIKDPLRLWEGGGIRQAEFDHQAILEGAREALHATLALWRPSGDPGDAELLERAADLRGVGGAAELLFERQRIGHLVMKNAVAVGIGGGGDAVAADHLVEEAEIPRPIFLLAEDAAKDLPGRVIDGGVQDKRRAPILEPLMVAAIQLDEQASLGHALAAVAVARGPAGAGTGDAGGAEEALERGTGDDEALTFAEELGEVMIIDAGVAGPGEGDDLRAEGGGQATRTRPASIAVGQGRWSGRAHGGQESADLPAGQAHELGSGGHGQDPSRQAGEDMRAMLLLFRQGHCLPVHGPRVTESLSY